MNSHNDIQDLKRQRPHREYVDEDIVDAEKQERAKSRQDRNSLDQKATQARARDTHRTKRKRELGRYEKGI